MSNIRNEIAYDVDKKRTIMENILLIMINSPKILDLYELSKKKEEDMKHISQEEFLAIYSLALELRKSIAAGADYNTRLKQYLWKEDSSINSLNLLKFVDYEISDMAATKAINPKQKWSLSVGKIFKAIDEKEGKTKICKTKE